MKLVLRLMVPVVLLFLAFGCGKDNPAKPKDPAGAQAEVEAGTEALAAGDYAAANAHFKAAIEKDPGNGRAQVGAAVTEIYLVQNDPEVADLVNQLDPNPVIPAPGAKGDPRSPLAARLGLLQVFPDRSFSPSSLGRATFRTLSLAAGDPPAISDVQRVIKTRILPRLQYAEDRLNAVEGDLGFTFPVVIEVGDVADTIEIDRGDLLVLDSVINGVQGWLGMLVAYNFDVENTDFENVDAESLLTAGTDWASLHLDGQLSLAGAKANFLLVKVRFDQAVQAIGAETDDQSNDVITQQNLATTAFTDLSAGIAKLDAALSGPVEVEVQDYLGDPFPVTVHLGRFFVPAIDDLKTKLPAYSFDLNGDPQITGPIGFEDPEINDIFPGMTNGQWQQLTGILPPALATRLRPTRH